MSSSPMTAHGFVYLSTNDQDNPDQSRIYRMLRDVGFAPWDGNGLPRFVILSSVGTKTQWFEAGYWAGARVPLFLIGKGHSFRRKHADVINRLGGWTTNVDDPPALLLALARRRIEPDEWDREQCELRELAIAAKE